MNDRGKIIERLNFLTAHRVFTDEWDQVFRGAAELLTEQEDNTDWKAVAMILAGTLSVIGADACCDNCDPGYGQGFYCPEYSELGIAHTNCWIEWAKEKALEVSEDE